jgi:hypothetical protein
MKCIKVKGECKGCGKQVAASGANKHMENCSDKIQDFLKSKLKNEEQSMVPGYLIKVVDKYKSTKYWMYFVVPLTFNLEHIDTFFRHYWLECCGHISEWKFDLFDSRCHQWH